MTAVTCGSFILIRPSDVNASEKTLSPLPHGVLQAHRDADLLSRPDQLVGTTLKRQRHIRKRSGLHALRSE